MKTLHGSVSGPRTERKAWGDSIRRAMRGADAATMAALTSATRSPSRAISTIAMGGRRTMKVQDGATLLEIANGKITKSTTNPKEIVGLSIGSLGGGRGAGSVTVVQHIGSVGPGESVVGAVINF